MKCYKCGSKTIVIPLDKHTGRKIRTCPKCDEYMGAYSQYERDV